MESGPLGEDRVSVFPERRDAARAEHLVVPRRRGIHPWDEQPLECHVLLDRSDLKEALGMMGLRVGAGDLLRLDVAEPLVRCADDSCRGRNRASVQMKAAVEREQARVKVIEEDLCVEGPCPL